MWMPSGPWPGAVRFSDGVMQPGRRGRVWASAAASRASVGRPGAGTKSERAPTSTMCAVSGLVVPIEALGVGQAPNTVVFKFADHLWRSILAVSRHFLLLSRISSLKRKDSPSPAARPAAGNGVGGVGRERRRGRWTRTISGRHAHLWLPGVVDQHCGAPRARDMEQADVSVPER